jgi:hypothetical protein
LPAAEQIQDLAVHERLRVTVHGSDAQGRFRAEIVPGASAAKESMARDLLPALQGSSLMVEGQPKVASSDTIQRAPQDSVSASASR